MSNVEQIFKHCQQALSQNKNDIDAHRQLGLLMLDKSPLQAAKHFYNNICYIEDKNRIYLDSIMAAIALSSKNFALASEIIQWAFYQKPALRDAYISNTGDYIGRVVEIAHQILNKFNFEKNKSMLNELDVDEKVYSRSLSFLKIQFGIEQLKLNCDGQRPTYHFYPELKFQPFYCQEIFEWASQFKQLSSQINSEITNLIRGEEQLKPYFENFTGLKGLDELKGSDKWSSIHFYKGGTENTEILNLCPNLKAGLSKVPLPFLEEHSPEVFISVLSGGTHIKPHFGLSNLKLTVHWPIFLPENCEIRVGDEKRSWSEGQFLIFDDSYEHEAWNNSKQDRIVLIFEIWHPELTNKEKIFLNKFMLNQSTEIKKAKEYSYEKLVVDIKQQV